MARAIFPCYPDTVKRYWVQSSTKVISISADVASTTKDQGQRVVTSEEAERLISEGWRFVAVLPSQKVVLEKIRDP